MAAALPVLAGCGSSSAGPTAGAATALPVLPGAETLDRAAAARAEEMCDAGAVERSDAAAVASRYDQETWAAVAELVGSAPAEGDGPAAVRDAAREEVEAGWSDEPALGEEWDRRADAVAPCGDGRAYVATVLARAARGSDAAPFDRARYTAGEVVHRPAVRYGKAVDHRGETVDLLLDLFSPADADADTDTDTGAGRPALVIVHGGGFEAGSRTSHEPDARAYARRGFVVATVDYRLDPDANRSPAAHDAAGRAALDDAMDAVRWLRRRAPDLGVDADRIAALGASAGGEVALGLALLDDPTPDGPGAEVSPRVAAAVSTGAYVTPMLGQVQLAPDDPPVFVHFYERDTAGGRRWTYAAGTCDTVRSAGGTCDLAVSEGDGHTVGLGPRGAEAERITAFLATHLALADGP